MESVQLVGAMSTSDLLEAKGYSTRKADFTAISTLSCYKESSTLLIVYIAVVSEPSTFLYFSFSNRRFSKVTQMKLTHVRITTGPLKSKKQWYRPRPTLRKISGYHGGDLKNVVTWDVTSCGCCKNQISEEYCLHHQGEKNQRARNNVSSKACFSC
jgi:hypothetical protein